MRAHCLELRNLGSRVVGALAVDDHHLATAATRDQDAPLGCRRRHQEHTLEEQRTFSATSKGRERRARTLPDSSWRKHWRPVATSHTANVSSVLDVHTSAPWPTPASPYT